MKTATKRTIAFVATAFVVTAVFWTAGFNFDERGPNLAAWLLMCLWFGCFASAYPFTEDRP
jgi:hypothetical protein